MLIERNEGILERCLVSGVTGIEILCGHVVTQFLVMVFQTALVLVFSFSVFNLENKGDLLWVVLLVVETGFCGMCFGMR
jgi:ABC-type transport system involved in cytochrome c biogenesis permease component